MNSLVIILKAMEIMAIVNSVMQTTINWGPRFSTAMVGNKRCASTGTEILRLMFWYWYWYW